MKNKLYLIGIMCCAFLLTGCGTKTLTCTKSETESGSTTEEKIIVKFKKDKVSSANMEMNMKFGEEQKSYIDMSYNILKSTFDSMKEDGLDVKTSKTDDTINVKLDVDFTKIKDADNLSVDIDKSQTYEEVKKELIEQDYKCK